jgi:hypothetical protein
MGGMMAGMPGMGMPGMEMPGMGMPGMGMPGMGMPNIMSMFGFESYDKQDELEEAYAKKFSIDITPYIPLMVYLTCPFAYAPLTSIGR